MQATKSIIQTSIAKVLTMQEYIIADRHQQPADNKGNKTDRTRRPNHCIAFDKVAYCAWDGQEYGWQQ